ncbi:MAG: hypothetical protein GQ574_27050 [Crocinitomix sp.]|nr:hypothetical protein [Crocinitomix sp.]
MKKILIYLTIQLLAVNLCTAQEPTEFEYLNASQVVGIYNTGDAAISLSLIDYRTIDNKDVYLVSYFDDTQSQLEVVATRGSRFVGASSSNGNTFFVFEHQQLQNVQIVRLNQERQLAYGEFTRKEALDFRGNAVGIETNDDGQLFIMSNYTVLGVDDKGKTIVIERGSEVLSYNAELVQTGKYRMEGIGSFIAASPIEKGIVISYETRIWKEKKYDLELFIFDNALTLKGKHLLTDNGSFFPSEIISHNNQIILAGYNMKNTIFDSEKTEGIFVRILNIDGTVKNTSEYSWDQLKTELKNTGRGDFIFNGKKTVLIEKILPTDGGFQLIGESYSSNSGVTAGELLLGESGDKRNVISVFDFVIFETNASGELTTVNILEKEPMNIEVQGGVRNLRGLALEKQIKRYKAFPFQSVKDNKITFINYRNKQGTLSEMDVTTGEITNGASIILEPVIVEEVTIADERTADSKILTKLDNMQQKSDNLDAKLNSFGEKLEYGLEKIDYVFNPSVKWDLGWHTLNNGQTIVYLYYPSRYSIYYASLN